VARPGERVNGKCGDPRPGAVRPDDDTVRSELLAEWSGVLKTLSTAENHLAAIIARLEQDEDASLADRIRQLTDTKRALEEGVSRVLAEFSQIVTIHKDINSLFAKLNQAPRFAKGFEGVTPINFLASAQ
jgi:hypothetical protein